MLLQEQTENIIKKGYRICANQGLHAYAASKKVSRGILNILKQVSTLFGPREAQRHALRLETLYAVVARTVIVIVIVIVIGGLKV